MTARSILLYSLLTVLPGSHLMNVQAEPAEGPEGVVLSRDPDLESQVRALSTRWQPQDATHGAATHIGALGDRSFATQDGRAIRRSSLAEQAILSEGTNALHALLVATGNSSDLIRQKALYLLLLIGERTDRLPEMLPVVSRSVRDVDTTVRRQSLVALGTLARQQDTAPKARSRREALAEALLHAVRDSTEEVQLLAAIYLIDLGHANGLPDDLRDLALQKRQSL